LVYIQHNQLWVHNPFEKSKWLENAYGFEGQYHFAAMPFVRIFFSGGYYAVGVFFVISGYVLSVGPLKLIYAGEYGKVAQSLSSALFRRWIRLFVPVLATTFLWMTSWHAFGWWCRPFEPEPTYLAELTKWYNEAKQYMFLYKNDKAFPFDFLYWNMHTWSIPFEFRGSIGVYTVLLGLSMCRRGVRLFCVTGLIWYFLFLVDGWFLASFFAGMLLCELDMLAAKGELPSFLTKAEPYKKSIFSALFIASVYIGGVPLTANGDYEEFSKSLGWRYLALFKPGATHYYYRFYIFWAATFLVAAIPRLSWLKAFFETRFCQYLGKVSFSLYLMHGPVIWTLGNVVSLFLGWPHDEEDYPYPSYYNKLPISRAGPLGLEPAFWVGQLVLLPATLWVSNIVTVLIDEPSVKFAAWLRSMTLRTED
jgi:peptidoglycan/LPS O-acetylase OafA/YrhL